MSINYLHLVISPKQHIWKQEQIYDLSLPQVPGTVGYERYQLNCKCEGWRLEGTNCNNY